MGSAVSAHAAVEIIGVSGLGFIVCHDRLWHGLGVVFLIAGLLPALAIILVLVA